MRNFSFMFILVLSVFVHELHCAESKPDCEMVIDFNDQRRTMDNPSNQSNIITESNHYTLEHNNLLSTSIEVLQPTPLSSINELCIEPNKKLIDQCDKTEESESNTPLNKNVNGDKAQKQDLDNVFDTLNVKLFEFTIFYDYYDVLTQIDKSIALIQELECAPKINKSRNSMIRKKMVVMIPIEQKILDGLYTTVENLYKTRNESIRDKFNYMIDGLTDIKKRKEDLKAQFERYKEDDLIFRMEDYQKHDCSKLTQLKELREELEEIRKKICPVNEQDLQNNAENYKNTFKKKVSDIYNELFKCHEKEKRSSKVLFDVYKNILKGIKDAIARLNSFNDDLTGGKSKAE